MTCEGPRNFKLYYFGGRGRAEFIRYIFAAGKKEFVDKRIDFEGWPELKKSMPTGQLPTLEFTCGCGDKEKSVKLPQSVAIAEFVAKVTGLYPECKVDAAKSMAWVLTCMDFHETWVPWYKAKLMEKNDEKAGEEWAKIKGEKLPNFAALVEKQLSQENHPYLLGDKMCWADLVLADVVDRVQTCHQDPDAFKDYPKLQQHCKVIHDLPGLKEYVASRPFSPF